MSVKGFKQNLKGLRDTINMWVLCHWWKNWEYCYLWSWQSSSTIVYIKHKRLVNFLISIPYIHCRKMKDPAANDIPDDFVGLWKEAVNNNGKAWCSVCCFAVLLNPPMGVIMWWAIFEKWFVYLKWFFPMVYPFWRPPNLPYLRSGLLLGRTLACFLVALYRRNPLPRKEYGGVTSYKTFTMI